MDDEDNKPKLKVLEFKKPEPVESDEDLNCDMVLAAATGKLKSVIVVGWTDNNGFYLAMSQGSVAENLMLLETSKAMILDYMLGGLDSGD